MTHTKGPWKVQFGLSDNGSDYYAVGTSERVVAKVRTIDRDTSDAALIAAAPDLLAACEAALRGHARAGTQCEAEAMLMAAIAKAKGAA